MSQSVKEKCNQVYQTEEKQNLCYRIIAASLSFAKLSARVTKEPEAKLETPSKEHVNTTQTSHPSTQCRLDTMIAGALCTIEPNIDKIPGRVGNQIHFEEQGEIWSNDYYCNNSTQPDPAARPGCWFKSLLDN